MHTYLRLKRYLPFVLLINLVFCSQLTAAVGDADSFDPNANSTVYCTAVQADGKILVGGNFTSIGGQSRPYIARLNADGSLDTSFNPNASSTVFSMTVQADGKILVGGNFSSIGGPSFRSHIARLNADGSLDTSFNPNANSIVYSMTVQADGKILVCGLFSSIGGQSRNRIARLNADGSLDTSFNPNANGPVYSMTVQADGKILVGGNFTSIGGQSRNRIARLNTDGSLDASFNPNASSGVYSMTVQADGKILVCGAFSSIGGQNRNRIARLNADGSSDASFNPNSSSTVYSMTVQADGKILVGGAFSFIGGQSRSRIARLNADGSSDSSFNPNASSFVYSMTVQADGKILVGGIFTVIGGQSRSRIARLENDAATQSILVSEESVEWQRGGSSPTLEWTRFDYSDDGSTWTPLGYGSRTANGWELNGLGLFGSGQIRAIGYKGNNGVYGGSGIYETIESFTLVPANLQPIANAGADTNIVDSDNNGSQEVSLDGSSSDDTDGSIVSYLWEWQDGGAQSTSGINPTVTLPLGTTEVTLTVTDDDGDTDSDTVNITVTIPTYPVTFDLKGKGTRTGGGILNQIIQINQDATAPNVSGLTGWIFTGWDSAFTNITAATAVTALYTADIDNVEPDQDATVSNDRTAPAPGAPEETIEVGSLTIEDGGSFELGSNETLVLNDGPLTIQDGAIFEGNGSIIGDVINLGLMIIRVTEELFFPTITNTSGFVSISRSSGSGGGTPPPIPQVSNDAVFSTDGSLEVTGTFTQGSTGKLRLFIEGDDPGVTYSQLTVGDDIDLDGEVQLVIGQATFDEFYLIPGKTFDIVQIDPDSVGKTLTAQAGLAYRILAVQGIETQLTGQGLATTAFNSGYDNDPDNLVELNSTLFTWSVVNSSILRATYVGPGSYLVEPEIAVTTRELSGIGGGVFSGLDLSFDTLRIINSNTGKLYEFVFGDLNREVDFTVTEITDTEPVPNQDTLGAIALDDTLTNSDTFDISFEVGEGLDESQIEYWRASEPIASSVALSAPGGEVSGYEVPMQTSEGSVSWESFTPSSSSYTNGKISFTVDGDYAYYAASLPIRTVTFILGSGTPSGSRTGGGELIQMLDNGTDAEEPIFDVSTDYLFTGWDISPLNVTEDRTITAQYTLDDDSDGIPDDYEITTFGNKDVANASSDKDKDGQLDIEEWEAGTDPEDSSDNFNAEPVSTSGESFTLNWTGVPGRAYTVSRTDSLGEAFIEISGEIEAPSTEGPMSFDDEEPPTGAAFYLISVRKLLE